MIFASRVTLNAGDRMYFEHEGEEHYYLATGTACVASAEDCESLLQKMTKEEYDAYNGSFNGWEEEEEYPTGYGTAALVTAFVLGLLIGLLF